MENVLITGTSSRYVADLMCARQTFNATIASEADDPGWTRIPPLVAGLPTQPQLERSGFLEPGGGPFSKRLLLKWPVVMTPELNGRYTCHAGLDQWFSIRVVGEWCIRIAMSAYVYMFVLGKGGAHAYASLCIACSWFCPMSSRALVLSA